jgi:hypothetical protein
MKLKTNFLKSCKAYKLDLVNKYLIKSFYCIPKIKNLQLGISTDSLLSIMDKTSLEKKDIDIKVRAFFCFFLLSCNAPVLKNKVIKLSSKNLTESSNFSVFSIFSNKNFLRDMFQVLYRENSNFNLEKVTTFKKYSYIKKELAVFSLIPVESFHNTFYILSSSVFSGDTRDLVLTFNVFISYTNKFTKFKNFFKFVPFQY